MSALDEAILIATEAHTDQARKYTGLPYVTHLIEVLEILVETVPDADENMRIAAILHDTLEDTEMTIENIEDGFGPDVAALVFDLTEQFTHEAYPWLNRKARKELEAERLGRITARAQTIKLADLISNTRSIVKHDTGFAKVYLPEKARVLSQLTQADPEMLTRATRSLTRSLSLLNLEELHEECRSDRVG